METQRADFEISQDFYGERYFVGPKTIYETGYSDYADGECMQRQAALCMRYFAAERMVDVGCATGFVVNHLRTAGRDAWGTDFSEYAVTHAPLETRPYLVQGNSLCLPYADSSFELVICLETLEHLWPQDIDRAISELCRISSRWVFASIPSFGFNDFGPPGLEIVLPSNLEDARLGRSFREVPLDPDGYPHHGHLTLATFQWWTEQFKAHGLSRLGWLERQINRDADADPALWQFYALQKESTLRSHPAWVRVTQPIVIMGINDDEQLGLGWHPFELDLQGRWTTQQATAYCRASASSRYAYVEYTYPVELAEDIRASVEIDGVTYPLPIDRPGWTGRHFALSNTSEDALVSITFRVQRTWTGEEVGDGDRRPLGLAVRTICLTPSQSALWLRQRVLRMKVRFSLTEAWHRVCRRLGHFYSQALSRLGFGK